MANHADNQLTYWASLPTRFTHRLFPLRNQPGLKMASTDGMTWLRGLSRADVESATLLSIPMLRRYYLSETRLYPVGKALPAMVEPSLLWTELRRALKVRLPDENFNFFGVDQAHSISLLASDNERPVTAATVDLAELGRYLHTAARIRTSSLQWTVLPGNRALIMGAPLLPIQGKDYYQHAGFLIPAGFTFRYASMAEVYQKGLADSQDYWYLLNENSELSKLKKSHFNHLSKGSCVNTPFLQQ